MTKIKFGTDGWRAIIADTYTVDNVKRVAYATAKYLLERNKTPQVVLGHDCRYGGKMFAEATACVLASEGIKVHLAEGFVSTPMVSLGCYELKADAGVVITASHNPPTYNGYKLKSTEGGPLLPEEITKVENIIPDVYSGEVDSIENYRAAGKVVNIELEDMYYDHIAANFDLELIRKSGIRLAYDPMFGAGKAVLERILPNATILHNEDNPGFNGQAPEPLDKNLQELATLLKEGNHDAGLANDGDADRIGMYDAKGNFVDAHHLILLFIHYLKHYKGMDGKVVIAFSVSDKVKKLCAHYGLDVQVTRIGFKYICGYMVTEDVLLGGEESGGIAVKGHIPERDGIWTGLLILELMAKTGKSMKELIQEVYDVVGAFSFERYDLHLAESKKLEIVENCKNDAYNEFGAYKVERIEKIDGFKYHFNDNEWVMIRPSGTEPVLRVYAEAATRENAFKILDTVKASLLGE